MIAWYFAPDDRRLRYGDGRLVEVGVTHTVKGPPIFCQRGLHASVRALDALKYARVPVACLVRVGGEIAACEDRIVATERTYMYVIDATDVLRVFSRRCALQVVDLWDCPPVVREYLETGREDLRAAARAVARAVSWAAARAAARAATWAAADATWTAADAAWTAADAAADAAASAATGDVARAARDARDARVARDTENATRSTQTAKLERMLRDAMDISDDEWRRLAQGGE
jgi:hypothetical protein